MTQDKIARIVKSPRDPNFFSRLQELFPDRNKSQLADILEVNPSAITPYVQGRIPGISTLVKISDLTGASLHWLVTGEGTRFVQYSTENSLQAGEIPVFLGEAEHKQLAKLGREEGKEKAELIRDFVIQSLIERGLLEDPAKVEGATLIFFGDSIPNLVEIPLVGVISAGKPLEAFEQFETVLVPESLVISGRKCRGWRVKGDSMKDDGILDGDIVVGYETPVAYNGQRVIAMIDDFEATIKRFYKEGSYIRLQPANDDYNPIVLKGDRVRISAVVLGIYRPLA